MDELPIAIRQRFVGTQLRDIERLYLLDDAFNEEIFRTLAFRREVLTREQAGDDFRRTLRLIPERPLPAPFSALAPAGIFHITETITYDFGRHRGTWRTVPSVLASRFRAEGTLAIEGDEDAVFFILEGSAQANIPLLGARAERQAVHTAVLQHDALADAVRARLLEDLSTNSHVHAIA